MLMSYDQNNESNGNIKVVDRRGQESGVTANPLEQRVAEDSRKPRVIPMRRCPICKSNRSDAEYLLHKQLTAYICLECGGMFMDKKMANVIFQQSIAQHARGMGAGVDVKSG